MMILIGLPAILLKELFRKFIGKLQNDGFAVAIKHCPHCSNAIPAVGRFCPICGQTPV